MKRNHIMCGLLLAAACGGGGKKTTTTTGGGTGSNAPGPGDTGGGVQVPAPDPTAAARHAFANPGGMWMPRQMNHAVHAAALRSLGVTIPAEDLSDPLAAPLNAVVSLGGCTASFVSGQGLIVTNHHCVQGALQYNSKPERNLVEDGFLAKTKAEELPAGPTQKVFVARAFTDVTDAILGGDKPIAGIADPVKRKEEVENRTKAQLAACEKDRPGIRCDVKSFFRGAEYQLIEYLEIRDVRLVYVPARSIGNYGGEIDNWAWPRHTGDWSFFRAYVGPDGQPADYSADNVPFAPKHWLKIDQDGQAEDDFVMVTGYPGRTSRVTTASEVDFDVAWRYPNTIQYYQERYDLLEQLLKSDAPAATKIKAGVAKQGIQNGLEKTTGVLAGLQKGDILERKRAIDDKVKSWAARTGHEDYKAAIEKLEDMLAADRKTAAGDFNFGITMGGSNHLRTALLFVRMAEERGKPDAARKPGYQDRDMPRLEGGQKQQTRQFDAILDRMFFKLVLTKAAALPAAERAWLNPLLGIKKGAKITDKLIEARLDALYQGTKLEDEATRIDLLKNATPKSLKASKDPFVKLAVAVWPLIKARRIGTTSARATTSSWRRCTPRRWSRPSAASLRPTPTRRCASPTARSSRSRRVGCRSRRPTRSSPRTPARSRSTRRPSCSLASRPASSARTPTPRSATCRSTSSPTSTSPAATRARRRSTTRASWSGSRSTATSRAWPRTSSSTTRRPARSSSTPAT
ncbi:MAG: S46 family peptidase [Myxococcales bacterium]|nr:S46 family peptidase [Myxococcales bacterium]